MSDSLRPKTLANIVGQKNGKERLQICIDSCKSTGEVFPHFLLYGSAGTGKSVICQAVGHDLDKNVVIGNGANISSIKKLLPYLMNIKEGDILFIDEVHRMPTAVIEFLIVVIEEFRVDLGEKGNMSLNIPPFVFCAATTNAGLIPKPLFDRFVLRIPLELYSVEELQQIVSNSADKLQISLANDAKELIAKTSRKTPHNALPSMDSKSI